MPSYQQPGLTIPGNASKQQIADLQRDLRSLGYLRRGIDGVFGGGSRTAVMALQHDLLNNAGNGSDGKAPVAVRDYNRGRVTAVTGEVNQALVACIVEILADARFPKLPFSTDPAAENRRVAETIAALPPTHAPAPWLAAVLKQESGMMHYLVPRGSDSDNFIVVGTDTNTGQSHVITSRGYGAGQYTLFHHPPRPEEVTGVMLDAGKNVERASKHLREKFDGFVNGPSSRADDRIVERGSGALTLCKYAASDARYMRDCVRCVQAAGTRDIRGGDPLYAGSTGKWERTQYYGTDSYTAVPRRESIGCDWPYAVRRYNGAGINSYHYQVRVMRHLVALAPATLEAGASVPAALAQPASGPAEQPPAPAPEVPSIRPGVTGPILRPPRLP